MLCCILLLACSGPPPSPTKPSTGGTLRVAIVETGQEEYPGTPYYDPGRYTFTPLARCCLLRTLLSYNDRPTEEGGAELRPDLAEALPRISADGLTWTFKLKARLHYAPPLANRVIEARDFITAAEHVGRIRDAPYLDDVVGMAEFEKGSVSTIAGMEAPDATTLVVRLTGPAGDFGNRVAMPLLAPLPAEALAGRDDSGYAGYLIASGPYMYEGAEDLVLSGSDSMPVWAGRAAGRVTLVRNPSWDPASDPLRPAYVDRIDALMVSDLDGAVSLIDSGEADVLAEPAPVAAARRYLASDQLRGRVFTQPGMRVQYMTMNLAVPPFDDLHVRRAVNLVVDRVAAADAIGRLRDSSSVVAHHVFPDGIENALLRSYDPLGGDDRGDVEAAREEMRMSRYDSNGDGRCDTPACAGVLAANAEDALGSLIANELAKIGIKLVPTDADPSVAQNHVGTFLNLGWGADYPNGGNFAGLVGKDGLGDEFLLNLSLLGASPEQLAQWGYDVNEVPSLNDKVAACQRSVGSAAFMCWAEVDQLMTERVMAWVPLAFIDHHWIYSERVVAFSPGPESVAPALEQIQLRPSS